MNGPLNEDDVDQIRQYHTDYNNCPSNTISCMNAIVSTSGRLHGEFVLLLFLQAHQETDRFFAVSGVQLAHSTSGQFHYLRAAFSSQLKSKIGNILAKAAALRITLNIDGAPIVSRSHTHPSHSQNFSFINLVFIFRCSSSPCNPLYARRVDSSALVFSLSSHRHSFTGFVCSSRFNDS